MSSSNDPPRDPKHANRLGDIDTKTRARVTQMFEFVTLWSCTMLTMGSAGLLDPVPTLTVTSGVILAVVGMMWWVLGRPPK